MKFETKYLIRWGIPGWVFATWIFIGAFATIEPLTTILITGTNFIKIFGILITLLSLGVPIGYLFQQIYFSWEWKNNRKTDVLSPIKEKIRDKINDYTFKTDPPQSIEVNENANVIVNVNAHTNVNINVNVNSEADSDSSKFSKKVNSKENFHSDYYYIEYLWHTLLLKMEQEKRDYIIGRYRHLLSTIHGLGSLMYSLVTSFFLVNFFWYSANDWIEKLILAVILIAHCFLFFGVYKNYHYYSKNLIVFQANFLKEMLEDEEKKKAENEIPKETAEQRIILKLEL